MQASPSIRPLLGVTMDELIYDRSIKDVNWDLSCEGPRTLHILHFNDVYDLDPVCPDEPVGGAARFATLMDFIQRRLLTTYGCHPLILFSGDFAGPSLLSTITRGGHMIDMLNFMGVHCATFGNHELDYGYKHLKELLNGSNSLYPASESQWVMTNITEKGDTGIPFGGEKVHKTLLFDWNGSSSRREKRSIRVGILAVSENWLNCSTATESEFVYVDFIESAKSAAQDLRKQGAEIIIALTHSRSHNDIRLSNEVHEIDLILGGHDHEYMDMLETHRIVKSGEEWRWISHVTIDTEGKRKCHKYETRQRIPPSPRVEVLCELYRRESELRYSDELFQLGVEMDPRESCVRFGEASIANWICDACMWYHNDIWSPNIRAHGCILPAFCFTGRSAIPPGVFTMGDLMTVCSKSVPLKVICISQKILREALQIGASPLPKECPNLFHVSSNMKYTIECSKKENTVSQLFFNNTQLNDISKFNIIVPADLCTPTSKITCFRNLKRHDVVYSDDEVKPLTDTMKHYCNAHTAIFAPKKVNTDEMDATLGNFVKGPRSNQQTLASRYPANPLMGRITIVQQSSIVE